MYPNRLNQLRQHIADNHASAFLITNPTNIFYLTGFAGLSPQERESVLLVTTTEAWLCVPAMYAELAKNLIVIKTAAIALATDTKKVGIFALALSYLQTTDILLCEGDNLSVTEFEKLQKHTPIKLVPTSHVIEALRVHKDTDELTCLRQAAKISDQVFDSIVHMLQKTDYTTLREIDIKNMMRELGEKFGADGFGFDPIVAVGPNSAEPHYHTGKDFLKKNNVLLLDFGFSVNGYTSDVSRTLFLGKPSAEFVRMYNLVKDCHDLCIQSCRPGMAVKELYQISVDFFRTHQVEQNYLHSLGHGLGLNVHEAPSLGSRDQTILTENMIITIEPGLYLPGSFGVRIEDDVAITKDGYEVLTRSTTDVVTIFKNSLSFA